MQGSAVQNTCKAQKEALWEGEHRTSDGGNKVRIGDCHF